jgi:hypothetical protein
VAENRNYVVGLPVVITVHDDGTVEWYIDKGEAARGISEHTDLPDDVIVADADAIEAAVQREYEESQPKATYHGLVRAKCRACDKEVRDIPEVESWNDLAPDCDCADDAVRVYEWEHEDGGTTLTRLHDSDVDDITNNALHAYSSVFAMRDVIVADPSGAIAAEFTADGARELARQLIQCAEVAERAAEQEA